MSATVLKLAPVSRQPPPRRSRSFAPAIAAAAIVAAAQATVPPQRLLPNKREHQPFRVPPHLALAATQICARLCAVSEALRALHAAATAAGAERPSLRRTQRLRLIRARPAQPTIALPAPNRAMHAASVAPATVSERAQSFGDYGELSRCKAQSADLAALCVRQRAEIERLRVENEDLRATLQRVEDDLADPSLAQGDCREKQQQHSRQLSTIVLAPPSQAQRAVHDAVGAQGMWVWCNHVKATRARLSRALGTRPLPAALVARNILPQDPQQQMASPRTGGGRVGLLPPSSSPPQQQQSPMPLGASTRGLRRPSHDPSPFFEPGCVEGFKLELGTTSSLTRIGVELSDRVLYETPYETRIAAKQHFTYIGWISATSVAVVSICTDLDPSLGVYEAVLRTEEENNRLLYIDPGWVGASSKTPKPKAFLKAFQMLEPSLSKVRFVQVTAPELIRELIAYEKRLVVTHTKIGVLYVREGQADESAMFANTETTPQFEEFLKLLGDRVMLKGWTHFNGDLDTRENATGAESVFRVWRGIEIMFHVSTMLPFSTTDPQQIARKSKIGNDIVVLVFKEGNTPFPVHRIKSTFTQVYILVQPIPGATPPLYRLSVATKTGIAPYPPFLHDPPHFLRNEEFVDFLLTKCLNAEQTSLKSPTFSSKMQNVRRASLQAMARKYAPSAPTFKQTSFKH